MVDSTGLGALCPRPHSEVSLMTLPSSSSFSMSPCSPLPSQIRVTISSMRLVPTRHGGHLPHELQEEAGNVDHAAVFVHDHEAARAHDGAELVERLIVDGDIEVLLGD